MYTDYVPHPQTSKFFINPKTRSEANTKIQNFLYTQNLVEGRGLFPFYTRKGLLTILALFIFYDIIAASGSCSLLKMFDELDEWSEEAPEFTVPLHGLDTYAAADALKSKEFQEGSLPPLNAEERQWLLQQPTNPTPPPTPAAQAALERQLARFNFVVPGSKEQWQSYIMYKYFELSLDPDPKISKPALDALAKTNIVGLHEDKQEISITTKSTIELQSEALTLLRSIARREERVIEGEVQDVE